MELENKRVLLAGWGSDNEEDMFMYQGWFLTLKKIIPNAKRFDTKKNYFQFGKDLMNKKLIEFISKEEWDLIIFAMDEEEIYPETILKIRELKPGARTIFAISDDDVRFAHYSRYFALLFDAITTSQWVLSKYKEDKIENVFYHADYNPHKLKPMDIEKKYDITFIGKPKADRYEILKYLIDNNINIKIFGWGWEKYPEFKNFWLGSLSQEDYAKVTNQSKISLNLTHAGLVEENKDIKLTNISVGRLNGRLFEIPLCKSFQIVQYLPEGQKLYKEGKEIVMFHTKEELLDKIKYYLIHEKEREEIAENSYKRTLKDYYREKSLRQILLEVLKREKKKIRIPEINKKITLLKKNDLTMNYNQLKEKLKDADSVYFYEGKTKNSLYKNNFLFYALEKTKKPISCCDYYVYSKSLGNYLRLRTYFAFKRIGKEANKLININQLMVRKDYFLKNLESFKKIFSNQQYNSNINLISEENTAFVSFPLTRIREVNIIDYELMIKAFDAIFMKTLFSLIYQKKILTNLFIYKIALAYLSGEKFMLEHIFKSVFNRQNWEKLNINKAYARNS